MLTPNELSPNEANRRESLTDVHLPMAFHGQALDYFILVLKTTLLTIVSLGLYYPWARCHRLNYLYRHTAIGEHKLLFHGTGREIAIGYLKALLIYGSCYGAFLYSQTFATSLPVLAVVSALIFLVVMYALLPAAVWGGRSYRASRLSYRGIRFGMEKAQFKAFYGKSILDIVLTFVTFGLYFPLAMYNFRKRITNASLWGNQNFRFQDSAKQSLILSFQNFLLSVFSLGLLFPATLIRRLNFDLSKTSIQGVKVRSELTWVDGYIIVLIPVLLSTLSLGLLHPWATVFATSHFYSRITFHGPFDLAAVLQNRSKGNALGETASSLLDIETGLGV